MQKRGFTLVELMIVVIIIGILAAMAIPSMGRANQDARTFANAVRLGDLFREARARAVGRNAAMLVRMISGNAYTLLEPRALSLDPPQPASSCGAPTDWANAIEIKTVRVDETLGIGAASTTRIVSQIYNIDASTRIGNACVCFTPLGRTYFDAQPCPVGAPAFFDGPPLLGAFSVLVNRMVGDRNEGLYRVVAVPPSGAARVRSIASIGGNPPLAGP